MYNFFQKLVFQTKITMIYIFELVFLQFDQNIL